MSDLYQHTGLRTVRYRFYKAFFRRAECHLCRTLVKDIEGHARWHFDRKHFFELPAQPQLATFRELKFIATIGLVEDTGWVTNSTGPR